MTPVTVPPIEEVRDVPSIVPPAEPPKKAQGRGKRDSSPAQRPLPNVDLVQLLQRARAIDPVRSERLMMTFAESDKQDRAAMERIRLRAEEIIAAASLP